LRIETNVSSLELIAQTEVTPLELISMSINWIVSKELMQKISGNLTSGLNRGAKFLALPVYRDIFLKELGAEAYCGTLNLVISPEDAVKIDEQFGMAHTYDNLIHEGKKVGAIATLSITLRYESREKHSVIVRPLLTSHSSETIEIVSSICFRNLWGLQDGDELTVILEDL